MLREHIADCVHCGFCLPTCPTYVLWSAEADSPRGRIQLMEAALDGTVHLNPTVVEHFDRCLGCMACVTSCPSGVRYDRLIETARQAVEAEFPRSWGDRLLRLLLFSILPYPRRMRLALQLAPLGRIAPMPRRLRALAEMAPASRSSARPPAITQAVGASRGRVSMLTGCVQSAVFGNVNMATARVLAAEGYDVIAPPQGCCGALSVHAGRLEEGKALARGLIRDLDGVETVIVNASGCGSHLKELGWLLGDERAAQFATRVRDIGEFLGAIESRATFHPLPLRVALQDSCHLRHAQKLPATSRAALARIPQLDLVEPAEQDLCCGSAGIYSVVQPDAARELGDRKAGHVLATRADAVASANPGCLVQLAASLRRASRPMPALHPIEVIDASMRGASSKALLATRR